MCRNEKDSCGHHPLIPSLDVPSSGTSRVAITYLSCPNRQLKVAGRRQYHVGSGIGPWFAGQQTIACLSWVSHRVCAITHCWDCEVFRLVNFAYKLGCQDADRNQAFSSSWPPSFRSTKTQETAANMGLLHAASVLLALASTALSFPTSGSQDVQKNSVVVESLSAPPRGWVKNETQQVDKEAAQIRLRMHLVHQDMNKFHELAMNVCADHLESLSQAMHFPDQYTSRSQHQATISMALICHRRPSTP